MLCSVPLFTSVFAQSPPNTSSPLPATPIQAKNEFLSKEPYVIESTQNTVRFESDGKGYRDFVLQVRIQSEFAVREFGFPAPKDI
jgi:hypothetical protein